MPIVEVSNLGKVYGSGSTAFAALEGITFSVEPGEFVAIVGPSGAGKTTLLKCLSGLMQPTSGSVTVFGKRVTRPPREVGVVFQDYSRSLMPWLTVRRNVEFPLGRAARRDPQKAARVDTALQSVGLADSHGKYPWQLSGGMQQRVAIARALAYEPSILIMDEPFASVDAQTRFELEDLVLRVKDEFGVTILFVTHDIDEAVYVSSRIVVLGGKPTSVRSGIVNELPWPRDQTVTRDLPQFAHLRTELYRLLVKQPLEWLCQAEVAQGCRSELAHVSLLSNSESMLYAFRYGKLKPAAEHPRGGSGPYRTGPGSSGSASWVRIDLRRALQHRLRRFCRGAGAAADNPPVRDHRRRARAHRSDGLVAASAGVVAQRLLSSAGAVGHVCNARPTPGLDVLGVGDARAVGCAHRR